MRAFINTPTAADVAPPEPLPVLGKLVARPASLKRGKGELTNVLDRYLDNAISTTEKRNRCKEELALLSMMETLVKEVIGAPGQGRHLFFRVEGQPPPWIQHPPHGPWTL